MPAPIALSRAPGAAHEWRLVRIVGLIGKVSRSGDRWKAELDLGGAAVPIVGQAGSGIPVSAVVEGRRVTVVGIVRRAVPSATDRRFSILPRSPADIAVGPAVAASGTPNAAPGRGAGAPAGPAAGGNSPDGAGQLPLVDLVDLGEHVGRRIRIGGLLTEVDATGLRLDDGTAVARVELTGEAAAELGLLEPGDAIDAIGTVERRDELVVVIDDPAGLHRVGDPSLADPSPDPEPATASLAAPADPRTAELGNAVDLPGGPLGPIWLVVATLASLAVASLRRWRARKGLSDRIAARLAGLDGLVRADVEHDRA
jgi:hypothetical protein